MRTATEREGRPPAAAPANPALPLTIVRQFTIEQIGVRLAAEPGLVARFWNQIAKSDGSSPPDLTVFYGSVGWRGQIYSVMEFVSGETLEQFVKRSEPALCEKEIPLFCRLLDAFEGAGGKVVNHPAQSSEMELLDFGVARAGASESFESHGAVLSGQEGTWSEFVFGQGAPNQVRPLLMELSSKLLGGFERPGVPNAAAILECTITSLSAPVAPTEPDPALATLPVKPGLLAKSPASPYIIGVGTALLILILLYGVGGFLAKRSASTNAGNLNLPPASTLAPEAAPATPQAEPAPAPGSNRKPVRQPNPTIVLTRGARPIVQTKLQYPADAKKERISGLVEMQVTIAEDGSVHSPRVLSGDPLLGAGLAEQISKWVYQPLRVNGKPVPMTTELAVRFDLNP